VKADNKKTEAVGADFGFQGKYFASVHQPGLSPKLSLYVSKSNMLLHTTKTAPWAEWADASVLNRHPTILNLYRYGN
jgi:hypothetical protein